MITPKSELIAPLPPIAVCLLPAANLLANHNGGRGRRS
jgi:hypothetical protein